MRFTWIDYTSEHASIVDSWMDEEALKYTGCRDGWNKFIEDWSASEYTRKGENFWCKVVYEEDRPFSAISLLLTDEGVMCISEYIVNPVVRGKRLGTAVLIELLQDSKLITGKNIIYSSAVIFPANIASVKAFTRAGFYFDSVHPDGDISIYKYDQHLVCHIPD